MARAYRSFSNQAIVLAALTCGIAITIVKGAHHEDQLEEIGLACPGVQVDGADSGRHAVKSLSSRPARAMFQRQVSGGLLHDFAESKDVLEHERSRHRSLTDDADSEDMDALATSSEFSAQAPSTTPTPAPLETNDGAVTAEIREAQEDSKDKVFNLEEEGTSYPLMLFQLILLWRFLSILCGSMAIGVLTIVTYKLWAKEAMLEQRAAKLQFLVVLALLIVCPAARVAINSYHGVGYWVFAVRNLLELWLMLLAFCAIPYMLMEYLSRCCKEGDNFQLSSQVLATSPSVGKFHLSSEVREQIAADIPVVWLNTSDWHGHSDMEVLSHLRLPMVAILAIRPLMQIGRSIAYLGFGIEESWQACAIFSGVSLFLLLAAVALGVENINPAIDSITRALGVRPTIRPLQNILVFVIVCGQLQDLLFLVYMQSEKLSQVFAGVLFMAEIVAGLTAAGVFCCCDPIVEMVKYRATETQTSNMQFLKLLLKPYPVLGGYSLDTAVAVKVWPSRKSFHPVYAQEEAGLVVRNVWRGVFLDMFTDKVRSKTLILAVVASLMCEAVFIYPEWVSFAQEEIHNRYPEHQEIMLPGVEFVAGLILIFCCWFSTGVILHGNNVYVSKWWLILPALILPYMAFCNFLVYFTLSEPSPDVMTLSNCWARGFMGVILFASSLETIRLLFCEDSIADFYHSEKAAKQYTSIMLERDNRKGTADYAKVIRDASANTNSSMLVVGAVATIPVVLAFALVLIYQGSLVLRYAKLGQVYFQTFREAPDAEKTKVYFNILDADLNGRVAPAEAGLVTILSLLGPAAQQLVVPMTTLWYTVTPTGPGNIVLGVGQSQAEIGQLRGEDVNRGLDLPELQSFLDIMHKIMALVQNLMSGDVEMAAHAIVEMLDRNKDGDLDTGDLPISEMALALQAMCPNIAHLVAPTLTQAWHEADTDGDGNLSVTEFPGYLQGILKRISQIAKATQDLVLQLVLNGLTGNYSTSGYYLASEGIAPAPVPELDSNPILIAEQNEASTKGSAFGTLEDIVEVLTGYHTNSSTSPPPVQMAIPKWAPPGAIDSIVKLLMENTASFGEATSLLWVACSPLLPDHAIAVGQMLKDRAGNLPPAQLMQVTQERWQGKNTLTPGNKWRQDEFDALKETVINFMQNAGSWLKEEGTRAIQLLKGIALGGGLSSEDAQKVVDDSFNSLDTSPQDGVLTSSEMGLHGALALVNPLLVSYGEDLFNFILGEGITRDQFGQVLQFVSRVLAEYVADVNGDGQVDQEDAKIVASTILDKLSVNSSASLMQTWKPVKLRKLARPQTNFLQYRSQTTSKATMPVFSNSTIDATAMVQKAVQFFVSVNIRRVEFGLYVAALLSFGFGIFVVVMPFVGYSQIYSKLSRGDKTFKGGDDIKSYQFRLDWASLFPGTLFSTTIFGVLILFFTLFAIFTILSIPDLYVPLLLASRITIIWMVSTLSLMFFLKRVVLDMVVVSDEEIVYPRLFAAAYSVLVILNFAVGVLATIARLVFLLPFLFVKFSVLSTTLLDFEDDCSWDGGYASFLAVVSHDYAVSNPIRKSFLEAISPQGHRLYGQEPPEKARPQSKLQRTRNRFWTAYMLSKAPELQLQRKSALARSAGTDASGAKDDNREQQQQQRQQQQRSLASSSEAEKEEQRRSCELQ